MAEQTDNPYVLSEASIKEPPTSLGARLKHLGPGLILSASIVGSGELIATTLLGAEAGFVTLWVILVSCLVKVTVQLEFGKHAIHSGESTMASFNKLPGPKIGKASWTVWTWLVLMLAKNLQVGGIIGGVAVILNIVLPLDQMLGDFGAKAAYCLVLCVIVSSMIYKGKYRFIEKASIGLIGFFAIFTFASVAVLQGTSNAIGMTEIASGLTFTLPEAALLAAIGAFGITGVGGDEIMAYNYWLLEKGYASYTGPRKDTPEWTKRAKGWMRVMYMDAVLSMVVYTVMTAAFYVLGAAVLHGTADLPSNQELIPELARMYTETLGPWAEKVFLLGAFVVLFSTLFAALAAWTRQFSDAFAQIGFVDFLDNRSRGRSIAVLAWVFPLIWSALYLFFLAPGWMVLVGGVITTVILVLVVFAARHFRYRRLPDSLKPSKFYDVCLWISFLAIATVASVGLYKSIRKYQKANAPQAAAVSYSQPERI